jgi:hypothetical protein
MPIANGRIDERNRVHDSQLWFEYLHAMHQQRHCRFCFLLSCVLVWEPCVNSALWCYFLELTIVDTQQVLPLFHDDLHPTTKSMHCPIAP